MWMTDSQAAAETHSLALTHSTSLSSHSLTHLSTHCLTAVTLHQSSPLTHSLTVSQSLGDGWGRRHSFFLPASQCSHSRGGAGHSFIDFRAILGQ